MRKAFNMIELIFVIVILGILAAVAIPKLSATRDDATVVSINNNIANSTFEIASYATSKGQIEDDLTLMSNSLTELEKKGDAVLSNRKAVIKAGNIMDCVTIEVNDSSGIETLYMVFGANMNDLICQPLQAKIHLQDYPMKLRGSTIVY